MNAIVETITQLYVDYFKEKPTSVESLAQAGSDRIYFRISSSQYTAVACSGNDAKENQTFIHHAKHFLSKNNLVPKVYCHSADYLFYLQEDLGNKSLYDIIKKEGITENVENLYKKSLQQLLQLQIVGSEDFDFDKCYPMVAFDKNAMLFDLNYFKYYFVKMANIKFSENELDKDFHSLCDILLKEKNRYFMHRDFQARNIMIKDNEPYFIDFQGGRRGALQYDVASLLWQAGANIPLSKRDEWLEYYVELLSQKITINKQEFKENYPYFVLIRLLQVLGAYGFRGLIEKRSHFLESIVPALANLQLFLGKTEHLPQLNQVIHQLVNHNLFKKESKIIQHPPILKIEINSFSYKRGIPDEKFGNGGGFVFDCRGILNPGRYEPYKNLHGKDEEVIQFLETKTKANYFLENIWKVIDVNIDDYIARDFEHLQINFGCTGGQHRSVYCAEKTKKYIEKKYAIEVKIRHIERELNGQFI